jgi:amino acid transporter
VLYLFWKVYSRDWRFFVKIHEMDLKSGLRMLNEDDEEPPLKTWKNMPVRAFHALF